MEQLCSQLFFFFLGGGTTYYIFVIRTTFTQFGLKCPQIKVENLPFEFIFIIEFQLQYTVMRIITVTVNPCQHFCQPPEVFITNNNRMQAFHINILNFYSAKQGAKNYVDAGTDTKASVNIHIKI